MEHLCDFAGVEYKKSMFNWDFIHDIQSAVYNEETWLAFQLKSEILMKKFIIKYRDCCRSKTIMKQ